MNILLNLKLLCILQDVLKNNSFHTFTENVIHFKNQLLQNVIMLLSNNILHNLYIRMVEQRVWPSTDIKKSPSKERVGSMTPFYQSLHYRQWILWINMLHLSSWYKLNTVKLVSHIMKYSVSVLTIKLLCITCYKI